MRKLLNVLVFALAVNFLAAVGGVAYLKTQGRLDRDKLLAIRDILFPAAPATQPSEDGAATQPDPAATQPALRLEELLARQSGRSATEQVEFMQSAFDAQMAQLDRRRRELVDLQRQVELAKDQLTRDREATLTRQQALDARETEAARLADDKGFQDSLALYKSMPSKQVKAIFLALDENTVTRYLQAMEPRTAGRIIKEFKTPPETQFIQQILEKMRDPSDGNASSGAAPGVAPVGGGDSRTASVGPNAGSTLREGK